MSDLNVSEVLTNVTNEFAERVLRKSENDDSLEVVGLKTAPLVRKGENYMSIVMAVDVETKSCKNGAKTYNLVAKLAPADKGRQQFLIMFNVFPKENHVYNTYFPELIALQVRKGVQKPHVPSAPKIYVDTDEKELILLFENLKVEGFRVADKQLGLDYKHCQLVLRELAVLHALSHQLIEETKPETLEEKYPFLADKFAIEDIEVQAKQMTYGNVTNAMTALDELGPQYSHLREKLSVYREGAFDKAMALFKDRSGFPVVIHGDCWINNMMFRYHDNNPTEVKLLDFQLTRVADCCVDLCYLFYTSTTRELREKYLMELLELYHRTFINTLHNIGVKEPSDFTLSNFKQQFHKYKYIGLNYAMSLLPMMLARPDEAVNMDGMSEGSMGNVFTELQVKIETAMRKMVKSNKVFCERLTEVIQEMADQGVL